jgi:hypothetical protein
VNIERWITWALVEVQRGRSLRSVLAHLERVRLNSEGVREHRYWTPERIEAAALRARRARKAA